MLYHPHTLNILHQFKQTQDLSLLKELLALLIDSKTKFNDKEVAEIIFSHTKMSKSKNENIKIFTECLESEFNVIEIGEKTIYEVKTFENISSDGVKLIKTRRRALKKKNKSIKDVLNVGKTAVVDVKACFSRVLSSFKIIKKDLDLLTDNSDKITTQLNKNKELFSGIINKIILLHEQVYKTGGITKSQYSNFINLLKIEHKVNDTTTNIQQTPSNGTLLSFLTKEKRKTVEVDNRKRFVPIIFDNSVYVYKLNNPNFKSLRRRKDLVNPKKMMFIKFAEDVKPAIYRPTENKLIHKISHSKIFSDIDYDEESTWEDDSDAESIDSEDSEEDDSSSGANEFIEVDSGEQERKAIKRPNLTFPTIKIEFNKEFDAMWHELPLMPTKTISDSVKDKLKTVNYDTDDIQNVLKRLSRTYMVVESSLKEYFDSMH